MIPQKTSSGIETDLNTGHKRRLGARKQSQTTRDALKHGVDAQQ